jgi:hypothetical protein
MQRRQLLIGSLALVVAGPDVVCAAEVKPFDAKAFAAAQEAGQGIVVHVHAPW